MFKNITVRQVTLFITIGMLFLNGMLVLFFYFYLSKEGLEAFSGKALVLYGICFIFFSFFLVRWILNLFIFEKLKLIYRIIGRVKKDVPSGNSKMLSGATIIEDVNKDVAEWAEDTSNQISSLKSLEEYRKQYVGVISHELKTPIFTIQGYIHTLLEGGIYDENINIKYLQRAAKNIDRLETIVEDLELINTLESGRSELVISSFEIGQLIKDVIQDLNSFANEKEVTMNFNDGATLNTKVTADVDSIRQVLINLITNSIKYGKERGLTEINVFTLNDTVLIEVSDDGIGIEEKHLKHLFDRFYRVDPSRSRILGGSGLGLSIVKHIMEAHNQPINVRSKLGEGTTFSFTLKIA